jgi:pyruvate/2-oxoglutarate dehydrogenase complex dihydrolipoamide dehydrogenase (E3) component/uncharacterized membrane protein YdjX (TVP38/TMEM64 family)
MKKVLVLLAFALAAVAFFALDLDRTLTLDGLKASLDRVEAWRAERPLLAGLAFLLFYVLVTAVSLPGAVVLTLAAGALFGLFWGTVIVSLASSIGATLAFLAARYLLRDMVANRLGGRLKAINEGFARDGALYLFTLRLVPLVPFFVVNLLMGLVPIRAATFYGASQLGMLAGTVVFVNAGTQLAGISDLSGIVSPALLLSFALLGAFPFAAKFGLRHFQRRRVYGKWRRPRRFEQNLIVIGAGAAGLVTAYIGAALKAKVTLVEAHKMGGDCLNYGCVPSKALIKSARVAHQMRHADRYGLRSVEPAVSFREVMARITDIIATIAPHDSVERYTGLGVDVIEGHARIVDPWTVEVTLNRGGVRQLTTRSIVIAAGASPYVPPLPGLDDIGCVTSDTLWEALAGLDAPPAALVVLGGGPIGCELAQSFARLGSAVTLVEMAPRLMIREDKDVSELARAALAGDGVTVLAGHKALRCERDGDGKSIVVEHEGEERRVGFDMLVCAVGRVARLTGYGLEELGIETRRSVVVNEYLETLYPNIYAAGDAAGPYQFTHTAAHQAWYAAVNALFGNFRRFKADYSVVPWATFIEPEIARVGLNEQDAQAQGIAYEVTRFDLAELDRAIADGATTGFVKVLTVPGKDRILGVTIAGEHAGDLLAEFVLAMKHGLGLSKILGTIHTYPTLAEASKYVAGEWRRAHAPQRLLALLSRYHAWRRG